MRRALALTFGLFFYLHALAQSKFDAILDTAIVRYQQKEFSKVTTELRPAVLPVGKHPRMAEALFVYASAAVQAKDYTGASSAFRAFDEHFPDLKSSEAWRLLETNWLLSRKKWNKAFVFATAQTNWDENEDLQNLFLNKCEGMHIDSLKLWLTKHPEWPTGNLLMMKALQSKNADRSVIEQYRKKAWKKWGRKLEVPTDSNRFNKSKYRIALLFPLELEQLKPSESGRKNQSLLNFISGFELACEAASRRDTSFSTVVYDYKRDERKLEDALNLPEMRSMDAIVGPILPKGIQVLQQFAQRNQIPVVNPLGFGVSFSSDAPLYQLTATPEAMGNSAFQLMKSKPGMQKAMVVFGTSQKDSLVASAFIKAAKAEKVPIALRRKVGKNSAANLPKYLAEAGLDSTTFVFVPNTEPIVEVQFLAALGLLQKRAIVLAPMEWLYLSNADYALFELLDVHFLGQYPKAEALANSHDFRKRYLEKTGIPAVQEAWWGFELGSMLCKELAKGKNATFFTEEVGSLGKVNGAIHLKRGNYSPFPILKIVDSLPALVEY